MPLISNDVFPSIGRDVAADLVKRVIPNVVTIALVIDFTVWAGQRIFYPLLLSFFYSPDESEIRQQYGREAMEFTPGSKNRLLVLKTADRDPLADILPKNFFDWMVVERASGLGIDVRYKTVEDFTQLCQEVQNGCKDGSLKDVILNIHANNQMGQISGRNYIGPGHQTEEQMRSCFSCVESTIGLYACQAGGWAQYVADSTGKRVLASLHNVMPQLFSFKNDRLVAEDSSIAFDDSQQLEIETFNEETHVKTKLQPFYPTTVQPLEQVVPAQTV